MLTSTVIDVLYLGSGDVNASLYRVYLVCPACNGKAEPVAVKQSNHVLAIDAFFGLPANVQSTAELNMAE